ncbi:heme-binding protein [Polynucleobacter sp. es-EL-1]|uniref:SOUL family heme-binding protein n=1 Tax=Polynucleobacter sp. es-EL-1 TaxID=1855652 RepID=UPI001BFE15ED|nr:heme-binding protein [Polynucleobacter sp. es-EL-1]QWE09933.1 heme-binding protein [Polynucleobacter sp. es-EL-1]
MATEEPKFTLLEKSEPFELREYAPQIVAEVTVTGDLDSASSQGFRLIAAYIFGQNQVSEKIAMTTPVGIESSSESKSAKIAMTTPVGIQADQTDKGADQRWTVSFVMPSEYTIDTLPKPLNSQVKIRPIPAEKKAVIIFSGFYDEEKVAEKTKSLEEWVKAKNWKTVGVPQFARYNPPWTLPFMRRNEILIQVRD